MLDSAQAVIGIGTDIVAIERIERLVQRFGARFTAKVFTATETAYCAAAPCPAAAFAKRYAAKEAFLKALGTGLRNGLSWHDFSVDNTSMGAPRAVVSAAVLDSLARQHGALMRVHVSLSDERLRQAPTGYALAFVVISRDSAAG